MKSKKVKSKKAIKILKKDGWIEDHQTGSHHIMKKGNITVSVPVSGKKRNAEIARGTLKSIEKITGVKLSA